MIPFRPPASQGRNRPTAGKLAILIGGDIDSLSIPDDADGMLEGTGWWSRGWRCIDWHDSYGTWFVSGTKDGHTFDRMSDKREEAVRLAEMEITLRESMGS